LPDEPPRAEGEPGQHYGEHRWAPTVQPALISVMNIAAVLIVVTFLI